MDSLFLFDRDGEMLYNPDAIQLTDYLQKLNDKDFKYVVMAYDFKYSPFHMFPPSEMKELSRRKIYGKDSTFEPELDHTISEAIEEYLNLNFDENRAEKKMLQEKLKELRSLISMPGEMAASKLKNIRENTKFIKEEIAELDRKIDRSDQSLKLKGDKKLSVVETWKRREKRRIEILSRTNMNVD